MNWASTWRLGSSKQSGCAPKKSCSYQWLRNCSLTKSFLLGKSVFPFFLAHSNTRHSLHIDCFLLKHCFAPCNSFKLLHSSLVPPKLKCCLGMLHKCIRLCICRRAFLSMYACICLCMCVCLCVCTHVHVYVCMFACLDVERYWWWFSVHCFRKKGKQSALCFADRSFCLGRPLSLSLRNAMILFIWTMRHFVASFSHFRDYLI